MKKSLVMLNSLIAMSFLSAEAITEDSLNSPQAVAEEISNSAQAIEAPLSSVAAATGQSANPVEPTQSADFTSQPAKVITPAVAPRLRHDVDFEISGDFIWWKTTVSGLEYAAAGISDGDLVSEFQNVKKGSVKSPKYQFEPGFKVALGMLFDHDGWGLNFQYTRLGEHKTSNSIEAKEQVGLYSSLFLTFNFGSTLNEFLQFASSKWKHNFNAFDAELSRNFFISRYLTLKPHVGLKFGWINSQLNLYYNTLLDTYQFDVEMKQNMWGVGLSAGVDTVWHFNKNWGIYADISFATLWSFLQTREMQTELPITILPALTTLYNGETIRKTVNVVEMGLGLCYMIWFKQDRYRFLIQAGWEEQVWLGFNNLLNTYSPIKGNMSMQGLTIKAAFAF